MQTHKHTTAKPDAAVEDISLEEIEALMKAFDTDNTDDIIEESLSDEELSDADVLTISTVDDGEIEETELAKAIRAINNEELADEIYEEQESSDDHVEKAELAVVVKAVKAKKAKAATTVKTPRATVVYASRDEALNAKAKPDFYLLEKADLTLDAAGQKVKHDEVLASINTMNVKIGKKCVNLLSALNGSAKLSTFIESGIGYIVNNASAITAPDFIDHFMKKSRNGVKSYDKNTAMPQVTNLLKLFTELKLLHKDGKTYTVNGDSLLFEHFEPLYAKSAA